MLYLTTTIWCVRKHNLFGKTKIIKNIQIVYTNLKTACIRIPTLINICPMSMLQVIRLSR